MSDTNFEEKTICDNVHGSIGISKLEQVIINTRSFQRLKKIKQLGLASLVFPGAEHSRFAHSIGAMHIMSRMVDRLREKGCPHFQDAQGIKVKQKLRLAALLHDIGHYPLSHLGEQAFCWIEGENAEPVASGTADTQSTLLLAEAAKRHKAEAAKHERLGEAILTTDGSELKIIIENEGIDPSEIARIFNAEHVDNPLYTQLMSSDVDCDRMDYLLRDSLAAGTNYGTVDVDYILRNLTWDETNGYVCYEPKARTAIEHFIMARFFSYNITYHKTILGFELLAKALLYGMMKDTTFVRGEFGGIVRNLGDVKQKIREDPTFIANFNDEYFWHYVELWQNPADATMKQARDRLLQRTPLRPIFESRVLDSVQPRMDNTFAYLVRSVVEDLFNNAGHQTELQNLGLTR